MNFIRKTVIYIIFNNNEGALFKNENKILCEYPRGSNYEVADFFSGFVDLASGFLEVANVPEATRGAVFSYNRRAGGTLWRYLTISAFEVYFVPSKSMEKL